jgi:hypothetical protein
MDASTYSASIREICWDVPEEKPNKSSEGQAFGIHCLDTRPETPNTLGKSYRLTGRRFLGFLRRRLNFGQAGQAM